MACSLFPGGKSIVAVRIHVWYMCCSLPGSLIPEARDDHIVVTCIHVTCVALCLAARSRGNHEACQSHRALRRREGRRTVRQGPGGTAGVSSGTGITGPHRRARRSACREEESFR